VRDHLEENTMTLVVGYASAEIGFLVSDSLLTPTMPYLSKSGPVAGEFHGLKIQIVHPTIAIAFASSNDADAALELIRDLAAEIAGGHLHDIPKRLFDAYRKMIEARADHPPDCEFLVLQVNSNGKSLAHITAAGAQNCMRAYLGDPEQYRRLTELRKPGKPPQTRTIVQADGTTHTTPLIVSDGEKEFAEISDAMEDLVHQRRGSVGAIAGCIIRVVDARISQELEYLQAVEASVSPWEGPSGFSLLASNSGMRGVGIYYRSGKMGFMLIVGDTEHIRIESAETIEEFIELGDRKYGLKLIGGTFGTI
jgi:hypothetical protein